jgi:hypothetical protein
MMLHQGWIGTFVQGLIMGAGMAVAMMVPAGLRVMARWARWGGRRAPPRVIARRRRRGEACLAPASDEAIGSSIRHPSERWGPARDAGLANGTLRTSEP